MSVNNEFQTQLFKQYVCELMRLRSKGANLAADVQELMKPAESDRKVDVPELYLLESALLEHLGSQDLKLRVAGYRDMLSNLLTPTSFACIAAQFVNLETAKHEELLSEAQHLASRVHRRYAAVPTVERLRARLAKRISLSLIAISLLFAATIVGLCFLRADEAGNFVTLSLTMLAGAAGASVSTLTRLYSIDPRHEPGNTWLSIESGKGTVLIAPLLGMVFAIVMYLLMRGGLVGGHAFPDFSNPVSPVEALLRNDDSARNLANLAKLLIWAFISGWTERLVPDVLDRLAPQARNEPSKSP